MTVNAPRVAVLTPPGAGAVGVVALSGAGAWRLVAPLLRRPGGKPLPDVVTRPGFWSGTLAAPGEAGDEVLVSAVPGPGEWVEVHGHGGKRAVRWLVDLLVSRGAVEVPAGELPARVPVGGDARALDALGRATTVRAAGVLLNQLHGAFLRTVRGLLRGPDPSVLARLATLAPVGRHLVAPWNVVVAGPPNVGKSSLVNALAGYTRSVVAAVPGTTRDVVTARVAFDGWPVELADTAGRRAGAGSLESAGIALARTTAAAADFVVWVVDASADRPVWPTPDDVLPAGRTLVVANKVDLSSVIRHSSFVEDVWPVSALTGEGVPGLVAVIARRLVPDPPVPGEAVPFTPRLADLAESAARAADPRPALEQMTNDE